MCTLGDAPTNASVRSTTRVADGGLVGLVGVISAVAGPQRPGVRDGPPGPGAP